eukprot:CAMPEP_0181459678 /NCGR_PEP_ID=MMETSP1110-20121109/32949_1 /TAXON_ID=174948 /ORGANISM="Symbiodinium sp., Strain CCMP421" /LENGTH=283 /DNA_ID=CAMNT_0023584205 /DNA_START=66 /DNA_END=915 /DNA_ORIENTATION=-
MAEISEETPLGGQQELAGIQETSVRHGFVRKVYSILGFQLLMTTVIAGSIMKYGEKLKRENPAIIVTLVVVSSFATLGMMFVFMCCPAVMRKTPQNYGLLVLFTLAESVMVGFICVQYTAQSVLVTFAITAVVVLALTLYSCQTKYDFTGLMPYFFVFSLVLCGLGLALSIAAMCGASQNGAFRSMYLMYAALGALLFSGYIVLDTQLIVGGKHARFRFTIDDYCMAAITIYMDIVQLFLFLLQMLASAAGEGRCWFSSSEEVDDMDLVQIRPRHVVQPGRTL